MPAPLWKPGQSGNPKGRPKGSRNKLGANFVDALAEDFAAHGKEALEAMRETAPAAYIKAIAMLLPRDLHVQHSIVEQLAELSDEELKAKMDRVERQLVMRMTDAQFDAHISKLASWRGQVIIPQPRREAPGGARGAPVAADIPVGGHGVA